MAVVLVAAVLHTHVWTCVHRNVYEHVDTHVHTQSLPRNLALHELAVYRNVDRHVRHTRSSCMAVVVTERGWD